MVFGSVVSVASVSGGRGGTVRTLGVTGGGGTVGSPDSSHLHDFPGNGGGGPDPPNSLDVGIVSRNNIGGVERDPENIARNGMRVPKWRRDYRMFGKQKCRER